MLLKSRLRAGDTLWLTKPIGTGVLTTAHKNGELDAADLASAIASMVVLNRAAAQAAVDAELHSATDVTGFSLVGHAHEMAERSSVGVRIRASLVPLLPGALRHAEAGISFGGLERNRSYFDDGAKVRFEEAVSDALRTLLLDPQTSGGLLVGVPSAHAEAWQRACAEKGVRPVQIGEVISGNAGVTVAPLARAPKPRKRRRPHRVDGPRNWPRSTRNGQRSSSRGPGSSRT